MLQVVLLLLLAAIIGGLAIIFFTKRKPESKAASAGGLFKFYATSHDERDDIANAAAGLQRKFKPVKEVSDRAGMLWVRADLKLAEELDKLPKAKGGE